MSQDPKAAYARLKELFDKQAREEEQCDPPESRLQPPPYSRHASSPSAPSRVPSSAPSSVPSSVPSSAPSSAPSSNQSAQAKPAVTDWSQIDIRSLSVRDAKKLFAEADAGGEAASKAFKEFMANGGSVAWREAGDLTGLAERALSIAIYRDQKALHEASHRNFEELRAALAGDDAAPIEKLAIDRVVMASKFAYAIDMFIGVCGREAITSAKLVQAQLIAERRVNVALKSLKTAREYCRAANSGSLKLFGSKVLGAEASQAAASA